MSDLSVRLERFVLVHYYPGKFRLKPDFKDMFFLDCNRS